jgi:polyisoprenoid-binding protein YceI
MYEYIMFTPSELSGLPSSVSAGQPFSFAASGDLTIKGISRPATFGVTLNPAADGSLSGSATSTVAYADWGVSIPSVPFVASVGQEVTLALSF